MSCLNASSNCDKVLTGGALGFVLQQPNIAAQTVLSKEDISVGITLLTFVQFLAGTILITVCQTVLENGLATGLVGKIPNFNPGSIASQGATSIRQLVPPDKLPLVLEAYNDALRPIWYIAIGLSGLIFLSSFGFEWKSVKKAKKPITDNEAVITAEGEKDKTENINV